MVIKNKIEFPELQPFFLRQPFKYDSDKLSESTSFISDNPTMTQQHFKDDCDVNVIVNRFLKTGQFPPVDPKAMYGDFLDAPESYRDALDQVIAAEEQFMELPAKVRERFQNDPAELLDFLADPKNKEEAINLGLLEKAPPAPSPAVPEPSPVPSPAPASPASEKA